MVGLATNGGFEDGATGWTLVGEASVSATGGRTLPGVLMTTVTVEIDLGPPPVYIYEKAYAYQVVNVTAGDTIPVSVWAKRLSGSAVAKLAVRNPPNASLEVLDSFSASESVDDWTQLSGEVVAQGSTLAVYLRAEPGAAGSWLFDDVSIEDEMAAKRREIEAAIAMALAGITEGTYSTTVKTVQRGLRGDPDKVDKPALWVFWSGPEIKEVSAFHRKACDCSFIVRLVVNGEGNTGRESAQDLAADIEKCLETQNDGKYITLGYVDNVYVSAIDPWEGGVDGHPELQVIDVLVTVEYQHNRTDP